MKILIVALAVLVAENNVVQARESSIQPIRPNLPEPIAYLNVHDQSESYLEDYKDVNSLNQDEPQQADQYSSDHSPYIIRTIINAFINNGIRALQKLLPDPYKWLNSSVSLYRGVRGFDAYLENVEIRGLSNINVDNINVNIWGTKATVILRLPEVKVHCGNVRLDHTVFHTKLSAAQNGTVSVSNIVMVIDVNINPIRVTVTDLEIALNFVGPVRSKLNAQLLGADVSQAVNDFVEKVIPAVLDKNKCKLEKLLRDVALRGLKTA